MTTPTTCQHPGCSAPAPYQYRDQSARCYRHAIRHAADQHADQGPTDLLDLLTETEPTA